MQISKDIKLNQNNIMLQRMQWLGTDESSFSAKAYSYMGA